MVRRLLVRSAARGVSLRRGARAAAVRRDVRAVACHSVSGAGRVHECVAADGGRSVVSGADGSASGREQSERSEARR